MTSKIGIRASTAARGLGIVGHILSVAGEHELKPEEVGKSGHKMLASRAAKTEAKID
jgi:hypothetical protein